MSFAEDVRGAARRNRSWVCVGLDTVLARIPRPMLHEGDPAFAFNKLIINATKDLVCCYKANSACYEALGTKGLETLERTIEYAHHEARVPFILDNKRGDVGHTAELYAKAAFEVLGADACTVSPYMGADAVEPFLRHAGKGVFVLARTSNPTAPEVQGLESGGKKVYEHVVARALDWDRGRGQVGLVAGATNTVELAHVRKLAGENTLLLVPGVGAQGGEAAATIKAGANRAGENALIHSSRAIIFAGTTEHDVGPRARDECKKLRDELTVGASKLPSL